MLGKPGGTASAFSDALGRMISLAETHGASPTEIVHQLRGIQDGHPAGVGPNAVLSVPDGVARAIAEHYFRADANLAPDEPRLPVVRSMPRMRLGARPRVRVRGLQGARVRLFEVLVMAVLRLLRPHVLGPVGRDLMLLPGHRTLTPKGTARCLPLPAFPF